MLRHSHLPIVCFCAALAGINARAALARGQLPLSTDSAIEEGVRAFNDGRVHEAGEIFAAAATRDSASAELRVGVALVAYIEGRYTDAASALRDALRIEPKHVAARILLGRLQRRTGDLQSAVHTYEALQADHPSKTIEATLDRWRREDDLQSRMQQAVGAHFSVAFEGPAEQALADRALVSLERAYDRVGDVLGVYPVNPILVVLYTAEQFRDITRAPQWAAGGYDGIIRVPMQGALEKGAELDRVLTHEFVHALQASITTVEPPMWFSEGLAGALETEDIPDARAIVAAQSEPVPLDLLAGSFAQFTTEQATVAYAASAVTMKRLIDEVGGMAIANILRDLDDGVPFAQAFAHRTQRTVKAFEGEAAAP
jgi:tetratricopeptide (TPR) repeat protein